ncbi:MAG TPA: glycerophosphodiester phosphodiesterase family protein [Candidatus Obscuribacterales bacterium]
MNFWDELKAYPKVYPRPLLIPPHAIWVIAHRGASKDAPENTLSAFQLAIEQKADMIELDIRLSRDGQIVVFHDKLLQRTTNGEGRVDQFSLAELQQLDAGSWFDPARYAGEQVPSLRQVLELCTGQIMLNIEIKKDAVNRSENLIERRLVGLLEEYDMLPHCMVSSFNTLTLVRLKQLAPRLSTALLYGDTVRTNLRPKIPIYGYQAYQMVLRTRADSLNVRKNLVTRGFLRRSLETGVRIHPFTVDEPKLMKKLIRRKVNGIITNTPDRLIHWLAKEQEKDAARQRRRT